MLFKEKKKKQIVFNTLFSKEMQRGVFPLKMSVSHPTVTQFPTAAVFSSALGCSTITAIPVLVVSDLGRCALLLKTGPFLAACFILTRIVPFYLCLLHVYIVSHIAQKKNNIKCIIFVVFEGLCVICLALRTEQRPPPALRVSGLLFVTVALQMETFISVPLIV